MDKDDASPVTEIDQRVEKTLRKMIHDAFPNHSIYGEEFGMELGHGSDQNKLWVLDPIDGTLSFVTGSFFPSLYQKILQGNHYLEPSLLFWKTEYRRSELSTNPSLKTAGSARLECRRRTMAHR